MGFITGTIATTTGIATSLFSQTFNIYSQYIAMVPGIDMLFNSYIAVYGKTYTTVAEYEMRMSLFAFNTV